MREWFSGSELAGMPGLPSSERRVRARAQTEGWKARERSARGGGSEYHIASLPNATRVAIVLRECRGQAPAEIKAAIVDNAARQADLWASYERKNAKAKAEAKRRVDALHALEQLTVDGVKRLDAYAIVAQQLGESVSTIRNWCRLVKGAPATVWAPLLVPKWVGRTVTAEYDARIYQMFRDLYLDLSRPAASTCYDRVSRWAASEQLTMPCYATLCRELKRREDPSVVLLEREGERALAASYPYLERSRAGMYAMEMANADGHNLDLAVVWPDGEKVRATLLAVQDVYSSAIIGWKLVKSESAYAMSLAFLDTFDKVGIPKRLFVDNTLAAASKRMTAGAPGRKRFRDREGDPIGVLPLLGIQVTFVTPAHGQAKPIERSFRTLADQISKHPAFSGAYLGNNTLSKPANYGERTITIAELEPVVANEIAVYNTKLGRRTEVCAGKRSFQEAFDTSYAEHAHEIARPTAHQRRLLYMVAERVTVNKGDGCVKLFKNRYWSEEVARLKGTQVIVRYHPTESLHDRVWVYRLDGTLVADAPIYDKAGFDEAAAAERITRARGQLKRKTKEAAAARRHLTAAEVAAMVPRVAVDSTRPAPAQVARKVDFTLPTTEHALGSASADRRAAEKRVASAVAQMADALTEPKRKRA